MVDFLRANPYVSRDEYMWKWTIPQIKIASVDFTHVKYLSEKEVEHRKRSPKNIKNAKNVFGNGSTMLNDLGIPIL